MPVKAIIREPGGPGDGGKAGSPSSPRPSLPRRRVSLWAAACCGVLGVLAAVAIAEAVALVVAAASSPLFAVGAWFVDAAPLGLKDWVIAVFGGADKPILFVCLGLLLLAIAIAIGMIEFLRPPFGGIILAAVGAVALVAVMTRAGASSLWPLPTIVGVVFGVLALRQSILRLRRWQSSTRPVENAAATTAQPDRRSFLRFVGISATASVLIGLGARAINAGSTAAQAIRSALKLPRPAIAATPIPAGASLGVPGISAFQTPADSFYRVDTALQVPAVDPQKWKLHIGGMVEHPVDVSFAELLALPLTEHMVTLSCVSNEVGGDLVGNATWLGYPVRDLLKRARPTPGADMVLSRSTDGWTAGTPLSALTDENRQALLVVGMNGEPLPLEHGFPVRMIVPGLYGYVSATKWVVDLTVTTFAKAAGYWTDQGWSAHGPVKLASRIDTPKDGASVKAGRVALAGVAWDQHVGIARVETRIDNGEWQECRLADSVSADTWRQWVREWNANPGRHTLQVRATNADGQAQTAVQTPPAPNGATGWHTITVTVS